MSNSIVNLSLPALPNAVLISDPTAKVDGIHSFILAAAS